MNFISKAIGKILVAPFLLPIFVVMWFCTNVLFIIGFPFFLGMSLIRGELIEVWRFYKSFCWSYPLWFLDPIFE